MVGCRPPGLEVAAALVAIAKAAAALGAGGDDVAQAVEAAVEALAAIEKPAQEAKASYTFVPGFVHLKPSQTCGIEFCDCAVADVAYSCSGVPGAPEPKVRQARELVHSVEADSIGQCTEEHTGLDFREPERVDRSGQPLTPGQQHGSATEGETVQSAAVCRDETEADGHMQGSGHARHAGEDGPQVEGGPLHLAVPIEVEVPDQHGDVAAESRSLGDGSSDGHIDLHVVVADVVGTHSGVPGAPEPNARQALELVHSIEADSIGQCTEEQIGLDFGKPERVDHSGQPLTPKKQQHGSAPDGEAVQGAAVSCDEEQADGHTLCSGHVRHAGKEGPQDAVGPLHREVPVKVDEPDSHGAHGEDRPPAADGESRSCADVDPGVVPGELHGSLAARSPGSDVIEKVEDFLRDALGDCGMVNIHCDLVEKDLEVVVEATKSRRVHSLVRRRALSDAVLSLVVDSLACDIASIFGIQHISHKHRSGVASR
eukprot:TRINITY_DN20963_c0_g1_i1.p1 TRINITY_DN20963_c0_g1~~TRINITY_DN20963_c0_g1_i1.p1  ORF type:complete len:485 (-),score=96.35 TRINITY_DN20963_c0_g1_i1:181-1635(-)